MTERDRRKGPRRNEDRRLIRQDQLFHAAQRLCQAFFEQRGLEEVIDKVLKVSLEVTGAQAGSVLLPDPETARLVFRYVVGDRAEILQGTAFPWDQGISGAVYRSGVPEVIADVKKDPRHFSDVDALAQYETHDMISIPLKNMISLPLKKFEGRPMGVLNVLNKKDGVLSEQDLELLTIVSAFAALAIQQAQLFEHSKKAEVVDLLGGIGHDLRNMMQPVVTGTELLDDEIKEMYDSLTDQQRTAQMPAQGRCREVLDTIRGTSHRIEHRVKQIADCVKGLSTPPEFKPCRVADIVESVFATLHVLAQTKGISLRAEELDTVGPILADETRLFNAFYNLVNNAIPEVPAGGSITIRKRDVPAEGIVALSVIDTGRGMPPEVRDRLFTPRAISTKKNGVGLGTKIVKDVVDAHKGQITVESELGIGTTFHIQLPRDPSTAQPGQA